MMQPFRLDPAGPVQAYKTYRITAPLQTHWRKATCAEVDCPHHLNGWATTVFAGSDDEALIRRAGRHFTVEPAEGGMLRFLFPAGQACFRSSTHRLPLERPALCVVRGGDWRRHLGVIRDHGERADLWVEDFAENQDRIRTAIERG